MKCMIALGLLAFVGTLNAAHLRPVPSRSLQDDFQDFLDLVPVDEVVSTVLDYYLNDEETKEALKYLQGKDFAAVWDQVLGNKEFQEFVNYLQDAGLDVVGALNAVADFLNLPHFPGTFVRHMSARRTGGLSGLVDDVVALLPLDELEALFYKKLETSPEFKELYDKVASADFQKLVEFVQNSKELTELFQKLRDHGVDVDKFVELFRKLFGWSQA